MFGPVLQVQKKIATMNFGAGFFDFGLFCSYDWGYFEIPHSLLNSLNLITWNETCDDIASYNIDASGAMTSFFIRLVHLNGWKNGAIESGYSSTDTHSEA